MSGPAQQLHDSKCLNSHLLCASSLRSKQKQPDVIYEMKIQTAWCPPHSSSPFVFLCIGSKGCQGLQTPNNSHEGKRQCGRRKNAAGVELSTAAVNVHMTHFWSHPKSSSRSRSFDNEDLLMKVHCIARIPHLCIQPSRLRQPLIVQQRYQCQLTCNHPCDLHVFQVVDGSWAQGSV